MSRDVEEKGFEVVTDVLEEGECLDLLRAFDDPPLRRGRAGARHALSHPAVRSLANDSRHRTGILSDTAIADLLRTTAPVDCLVPRGGVLLMRPLLLHASSKAISSRPRRVLHLEYARSLTLGPGHELAVC